MAEREDLFDVARSQTPRLQSNLLTIEDLERGSQWMGGMVGCSPKMLTVFAAIERISRHKTTTIIEGESGTGKELVARALHTYGPTPSGPFVIFNCSNLVDSLAESQLFGHVRGAFTDAREESRGYFRSADGGTLFLDEIGEMPLRLQAKLLRAVETHEVQPVGGSQIYKVDIRLLCATNRDLRTMVRRGEFRNDLFYRLNTCAILIPPLRERPEDVPVLTAHFLRHHSRALDKNVSHIS